MIKAFRNYHFVFWNYQMFAKCYLQVIIDTNTAFNQWTSADVTNLFLCMLVVSIPTLKYHKLACIQQLNDIGLRLLYWQSSPNTMRQDNSLRRTSLEPAMQRLI